MHPGLAPGCMVIRNIEDIDEESTAVFYIFAFLL